MLGQRNFTRILPIVPSQPGRFAGTMLPLSPGGKHAVVPAPQPRGLSAPLIKKWAGEVLGDSLLMLPRGRDISGYLQFHRLHLPCGEIAEELCRAACP